MQYSEQFIAEKVREAYEEGLKSTSRGTVASYIPELAKSDGSDFGICVMLGSGKLIEFGDTQKRFSIQSISKIISLAVALKLLGDAEVFSGVQMEPSGDSFNSILKLDTASDKPYNPLINAGAIQVTGDLANVVGFDELLGFAREFCRDDEICLNEAVYHSEAATGDRNRAIAYLLKSKGVLRSDPLKTVDLYFRMCSLNVSARSLAGLASLLANRGIDIVSGRRLLDDYHIRVINTLMFTCGLYDGSGEFAVKAGIPAKSGVGGGICAPARAGMGIGTYGPALDARGNSVGGISAICSLSDALGMHMLQ